MGVNLATFIVWFFDYKFVYSSTMTLSIFVLALEILPPVVLFNSVLLKKAASKIESMEL